MITSHFVTEPIDINQIISECVALAKSSGASIPFQYLHMSLKWGECFHTPPDSQFWIKRGKNFLGTQSRLENFFLLVAKNDETLCGFVPLARYAVKTPGSGKEPFNIITFAGDYVLVPFQDFVAQPSCRQEVVFSLLDQIARLLGDRDSLFWAGYLPEESPHLPILRAACSKMTGQQIQYEEAITYERGGVWPWTIGKISATLIKICEAAQESGEKINNLQELATQINKCRPQTLLFPRTRKTLLHEIQTILEHISHKSSLSQLAKDLNGFLKNTPMLFPYIELPAVREEYLASLGYSTRRYFRRYMKKFREAGGDFETVNPSDIIAPVNKYLNHAA